MTISAINVHNVEKIGFKEECGESHKWVTTTYTCKDGTEHDFAVFDVTLYDYQNAIENALHERKDDGYCI